MPREIIGLNVSSRNFDRKPRVVTFSPRAGKTLPFGFRVLFEKPRYDKIIIAPPPENIKSFSSLGQISVKTAFTSETAEVYLDDKKEPVVFYLSNPNHLFSAHLYPHQGENEETVLKRIAFFNQAALNLLKEAEINPDILHFIDWPTALGLAYAKRSKDSPYFFIKTLFTYLDARYQGLFPLSLYPVLGLEENSSLRYYEQVSLAKMGALNADLTITGSYEHIREVLENRRVEGGDFGEFSLIFRQLSEQGRLNYLFHSNESLRNLGSLNFENPSPRELDILLSVATIYQVRYDHLVPQIKPEEINEALLLRAVVEGKLSRRELDVPTKLLGVLSHPFFNEEQKTIIKRICHDFGSTQLIDFLREQLRQLDKARRENDNAKASIIEQALQKFFTQIKKLEIDWGLYRRIAEKVFYGAPKNFIKLEAIHPYSLNRPEQKIVELGKEFLTSGNSEFSPLMILTMAGGLGQRLGFSITINYEKNEVVIPPEVPKDFIPHLEPLIEEAKKQKLTSLALPKGVFILPGQPYSLFEQQARSLAKLSQVTGKKLFWTIMTSDENHEMVKYYFQSTLRDGKYFGILNPELVIFVPQENYPAVKKEEKKFDLYITEQSELYATSGGHGGFYSAAATALQKIKNEYQHEILEVLACNIENVLFNYRLGDLDFIANWLGYKRHHGHQVTGLATTKGTPQELMGIFAKGDNVEQVVEYNHPSFSVFKAFAYESEKMGEVFFVRDAKGKILVLSSEGLKKLFKTSPEEENWMSAIAYDKKTGKAKGGGLREGYTLIGSHDFSSADEFYLTALSSSGIVKTSEGPFSLNDLNQKLGEIQLKYRLGNTNIFILSKEFIGLVVTHPEISLSEEYKSGDTPFPQVKKIERAIFGPLANIIAYERLTQKDILLSIVEAPREDCFEPIKGPNDISVVQQALQALLNRHPYLK